MVSSVLIFKMPTTRKCQQFHTEDYKRFFFHNYVLRGTDGGDNDDNNKHVDDDNMITDY